jgi:hypothetical protein
MNTKLVIAVLVVAAVIAVVVCGNRGISNDAVNAAGSFPSAGNGNSGAAPTPTDFGPMKTVEIIDPMFKMPAYTMSIPKSWNFEGTVLYGPGCLAEWFSVAYRAYSPDMLYGIQAMPSADFFWADDPRAMPTGPDCKNLQPMSAADYGKLVSIRMRPGSEIDSVETSPNEAAAQASIDKKNQSLAAQAASVGNRNPSKYKVEIKRLHLHYNFNGRPEEEELNIAMSVGDLPNSTIVSKPSQAMQLAIKHRMASSVLVSGSRTPQGQFQAHADAIRAIGMSIKLDPEYQSTFNAYLQNKNNRSIAGSWAVTHAILQKGAQEQAQRTQQAQAFIQNMQQQGDVRRQQFNADMDRKSAHAQDVSDYLLDQQLYVNPTTGEKTMASNQYNKTYTNGSGPGEVIVQTNTYNPNGLLLGNWTELQPIKH